MTKLGLKPLVDTSTGLSIFQEQQWGLQAASANLSYQSSMFNIGQSRQKLAMSDAMTFGGSFLNPVTGQTETIGMGTMEMNRILFNQGIEQQLYGFAFQEREMGLSHRKATYGFEMQERDIERSSRRQEEEYRVDREQLETRYQWRIADWSHAESKSQLDFGWQMEDMDRNLRYARGRERLDILRQKERATIGESMRREQSETQRDRMDVEKGWQDEALERNKKYYEEDKELQRERLKQERKFYEESREMQQERFKKEREWADVRIQFQREQHRMSEMQAEIESKMQHQALDHSAAMAARQHAIQMQEMAISQEYARRQAAMQKFLAVDLPALLEGNQANVRELFNIFGSEALKILAMLRAETYRKEHYEQSMPAKLEGMSAARTGRGGQGYASGGYVDNDLPSFGSGGYTGNGFKYEPKGVVHGGEWVVPTEGALVLRGDNPEMVKLLQEIARILGKIEKNGPAKINQTVYTQNPEKLNLDSYYTN